MSENYFPAELGQTRCIWCGKEYSDDWESVDVHPSIDLCSKDCF